MNRDITYCADTTGCPYKYKCKRNLDNYKFTEGEKEQLWVGRFEHSNTKCEWYFEQKGE